MDKLKIDFIKTEDKTSKAGKPYVSVSVKSGEFWYNAFGSDIEKIQSYTDEVIKKDTEIECEISEEKFNGRTYRYIKPIMSKVKKKFGSSVDLTEINKKLDLIISILNSEKIDDNGLENKVDDDLDL